MNQSDYLLQEATNFIHTCYTELGIPEEEQNKRISDIEDEIHRTGTYVHTSLELTHGAKMAWRNNNRSLADCFGIHYTLLMHDIFIQQKMHMTNLSNTLTLQQMMGIYDLQLPFSHQDSMEKIQ